MWSLILLAFLIAVALFYPAVADTGIEVSETDHIITLITCDRSFGGVQGRLLVMGVEQ